MTIIVHHLNNSRSQRILWMLEELGLPYELRRYERDAKTMLAPPELKAVHPLGKSPVLQDGARIVIESGAICDYLVDKAGGRLGPPDGGDGLLRYRQFLHYAEGSLMPPLLAILVSGRIPLFGKVAVKRLQGMMAVHFQWLDAELASRPWFAGDALSAADIMMSFPLEASRARAGLDARYPHVLAWLDRIHTRPAYVHALERGGAYAYA